MLRADSEGLLLAIRVIPRASREKIVGERAGRLVVQVTAPLGGRANEAVRRLPATALHTAPSAVIIQRGERSRDKLIRIAGLDAPHARELLTPGP